MEAIWFTAGKINGRIGYRILSNKIEGKITNKH
jgi:hypothetical protein